MRLRRVYYFLLTVGALVACITGALWTFNLRELYSHRLESQAAMQLFLKSREHLTDDLDSFIFKTRGVTLGDSSQVVDSKMHGYENDPVQLSPSGQGGVGAPDPSVTAFVKTYEFHYGPLRDENGKVTREFIREFYRVLFDEAGSAFAMERHLFIRHDPDRSGVTRLDLRTGAEHKVN